MKLYKNLTANQLKKACEENKFILVRMKSGRIWGMNCKLGLMVPFLKLHGNYETPWIGFKPCSYNEYLTYKAPMALHKFKEYKQTQIIL